MGWERNANEENEKSGHHGFFCHPSPSSDPLTYFLLTEAAILDLECHHFLQFQFNDGLVNVVIDREKWKNKCWHRERLDTKGIKEKRLDNVVNTVLKKGTSVFRKENNGVLLPRETSSCCIVKRTPIPWKLNADLRLGKHSHHLKFEIASCIE